MNITEHIFASCEPDAIALLGPGEKITYGELRQLTLAACKDLEASGWILGGPGRRTRVALHCPNGVDHIILSLAVLAAGGCLLPVPGELSRRERDNLVSLACCDLVLCAGGARWHREAAQTVPVNGVRQQRALLCRGILPTEAACCPWEAEFARLNPALVRFSSGTTGTSKGVVLSHEALLQRVIAGNSGMKIGQGDRIIWILPMAHHFAVSIVLYLLHGACTVLLSSHLAEDIDRGIREHRGTVLYGAPFHYQLLSEYAPGRPHDCLRLAVSTAAPLSPETARAFRNRYGLPLTQGLGIIEVGLPLLNCLGAESDPLSVGSPQAGFEARLCGVDADGIGELLLRGPGLFDAYLSPWQTRRAVLDADGWFHTGDLCTIAADGQVTLRGRTKSVINVAGIKVFAEQVEAVLNTCPGVRESRVVAEPHPAVGEIPVAELVACNENQPPSFAELLSFCREHLSAYHMPVKVRWVEALPRTASGKLKRNTSL